MNLSTFYDRYRKKKLKKLSFYQAIGDAVRSLEEERRANEGGEVNEFRRVRFVSLTRRNASPAFLGLKSLNFGPIGEAY